MIHLRPQHGLTPHNTAIAICTIIHLSVDHRVQSMDIMLTPNEGPPWTTSGTLSLGPRGGGNYTRALACLFPFRFPSKGSGLLSGPCFFGGGRVWTYLRALTKHGYGTLFQGGGFNAVGLVSTKDGNPNTKERPPFTAGGSPPSPLITPLILTPTDPPPHRRHALPARVGSPPRCPHTFPTPPSPHPPIPPVARGRASRSPTRTSPATSSSCPGQGGGRRPYHCSGDESIISGRYFDVESTVFYLKNSHSIFFREVSPLHFFDFKIKGDWNNEDQFM